MDSKPTDKQTFYYCDYNLCNTQVTYIENILYNYNFLIVTKKNLFSAIIKFFFITIRYMNTDIKCIKTDLTYKNIYLITIKDGYYLQAYIEQVFEITF